MPQNGQSKKKVAVLGGGVGAMTTALYLTQTEKLRQEYEVTVYQLGWRLGGKGASGRNSEKNNRIEEHGLHIWLGFYENAFRAMRLALDECREEGLVGVFRDYKEAFSKQSFAPIMDDSGGGWQVWPITWPTNDDEPGDRELFEVEKPDPLDAWDYLREIVQGLSKLYVQEVRENLSGVLRYMLRDLNAFRRELAAEVPDRGFPWGLFHAAKTLAQTSVKIVAAYRRASTATEALKAMRDRIEDLLELILDTSRDTSRCIAAAEEIQANIREMDRLEDDLPLGPSPRSGRAGSHLERFLQREIRRFLLVADFGLAAAHGIIADDVLTKGFDEIEDVDFMEWLDKNGAIWPESSPLVRGWYDASFAYEGGVSDGLHLAAGTGLHAALRFAFTHKGSVMYRMNAGMGDAIFTPFYKVLEKRGVKFELFHKVTDLRLSTDRRSIESIDCDVQAIPKNGSYNPFVRVGRLDCWPHEPKWEELKDGEELRDRIKAGEFTNPNIESWWTDIPIAETKTLRRGEHFDEVVLGIAIGALPHICKHMIEEAEPPVAKRWRQMLTNVKTTRTQALQLWINKKPAALGWSGDSPILTSYVEPFDTWGDLSHLIGVEDWGPNSNLRQIAYFCNVFPEDRSQPESDDPDYPNRVLREVKANALKFLNENVARLWPQAASNGEFDWALLEGNPGKTGVEAIDTQFVRVNIDPTELYVLNVPGSAKHRLLAGGSGFDNLVLAGDWTRTSLSLGCVEAAVMSGMMAAHALCRTPDYIHDRLTQAQTAAAGTGP